MTTVFLNNLRRTFRSAVRLIILVVIPLVFMNLFIPKSYEVPFKVGFIDEDDTVLTQHLAERLGQSFHLIDMSEEDIMKALVDGELNYALVARKGFTDGFLRTGTVALEGYGVGTSNVSVVVNNLANSFLNSIKPIATAAAGNVDVFLQGLKAFSSGTLTLGHVPVAEASRLRTLGVLGFLIQFMIYMSVMTTGLILEEKNNRSLYRVLTAPISVSQYMAGHLFSALAVALVQISSIFLFMKYAMGIYFGGYFLSLFFLYAVFGVVCISMGLLITAYCSTPRQAYVVVIMLATPLVMLGGAYWPRSFMPEVLIRISNLLPTTWVMEASAKLVRGGTLSSIGSELTILLGFAVVFFAGGVLRKVDIAK